MTNLDSILKSRDIALPTKVRLVKAMVFPVVMYGCESWTVKKAEHWKIDVFELWCWRRLLRVPWTARRSNQSILKGCWLEGLMLKLKFQYFGHLMWRVDSLGETLMLGGIGGRRRRRRQRMRWLNGITNLMVMSLSELRELVMDRRPGVLRFMGSQRVRHDWAPEELNYQPYKKQSKQLQVSNWRRKSQWVHKGAIFVPCTLFNSFHIPNFSPVFISDKVLCNITTTQYFPSLSCCS